MLLAKKIEVNQTAIGSGVVLGVFVVIVIIVLTVFLILRRRKRNSDFVPKIMQEEVMNATFALEPDNEYAHVSYENSAVHIIDAKKAIHSQNLTPHSINNGSDVTTICVESMAIPRPCAKDNNLTKADITELLRPCVYSKVV
ncbi:hypothetical protein CHS0354_040497 [Potamilus streckersoni]|uniref:Uncharacterized protein n=1 Tax=Potamilus streckersoni TaxID=2493646 RepID=A0AAE0TK21_9BIVA|nr:hypothetical protein CHS0354_040497 [Potamilus streckersoni]